MLYQTEENDIRQNMPQSVLCSRTNAENTRSRGISLTYNTPDRAVSSGETVVMTITRFTRVCFIVKSSINEKLSKQETVAQCFFNVGQPSKIFTLFECIHVTFITIFKKKLIWMMLGHKPLDWGHDIITPKGRLEMINQDRMIVADFSVNSQQIFIKFCRHYFSNESQQPYKLHSIDHLTCSKFCLLEKVFF